MWRSWTLALLQYKLQEKMQKQKFPALEVVAGNLSTKNFDFVCHFERLAARADTVSFIYI